MRSLSDLDQNYIQRPIRAFLSTEHMHKRIEFLDVLRVFAFITVLIGHKFYTQLELASTNPNIQATLRLLLDILRPFVSFGGAGVIVFFLVSGYIISHVLQTENTPIFLVKRIFRIYPLYMFAVLAEICLAHWISLAPFPPYSILLPRLLLVGDLFSTPHALAGVEWTLRLEITFYVVMASLRTFNLLKDQARLPLIYFLLTVALQLSPPYPHTGMFTDGYLTLFFPFFFVGSSIYLREHKLVSSRACWAYVLYALLSCLVLWPAISPATKGNHFQILGCLLFGAVWGLRNYVRAPSLIIFLSNLTYSVYLFHNWLWEYLLTMVSRWYVVRQEHRSVVVLLMLFLICIALHYSVEKWGIRLGANLVKRLGKRLTPTPLQNTV